MGFPNSEVLSGIYGKDASRAKKRYESLTENFRKTLAALTALSLNISLLRGALRSSVIIPITMAAKYWRHRSRSIR